MLTYEHALQTLLWSESDDNGDQLSRSDATPSPELVQRIRDDWERFSEAAEAMGFDPERDVAEILHPDNEGDAWNQAAHDFILTRNHHGAGFWDGGWHEPWDKRLTDLAHSFGELNCYVGGDGLIYGE